MSNHRDCDLGREDEDEQEPADVRAGGEGPFEDWPEQERDTYPVPKRDTFAAKVPPRWTTRRLQQRVPRSCGDGVCPNRGSRQDGMGQRTSRAQVTPWSRARSRRLV